MDLCLQGSQVGRVDVAGIALAHLSLSLSDKPRYTTENEAQVQQSLADDAAQLRAALSSTFGQFPAAAQSLLAFPGSTTVGGSEVRTQVECLLWREGAEAQQTRE